MKHLFILALLLGMITLSQAQNNQQQKIDSVCSLVKKYFNEKNDSLLYSLTGESFHQQLSPESFKKIFETNLFPLGEMKAATFEKMENGIGFYKTVFPTATLSLLLSLDDKDKIAVFLFKPYVDENSKKDYKIPSNNAMATPLDKEVDALVQPYITLKITAGLSIAILQNGKTTFYGYGETARGNKELPGMHTLFEIGSITKTFTATLLAEAVNSGKVKLDDPINKYLPDSIPELSYDGIPVTLKTLANHTSGIHSLPSNFHPSDPSNPYKDYTREDLFSFYKNYKLTRKPGDKYEYSNVAFGTLGVILERVYHQNYESLVLEKICKPLHMDETIEYLRKDDSARFAKGYDGEGRSISQWDFQAIAGAGSIRSTASGLIKYAKANLGDAPPLLNKAIQLTHQVTYTGSPAKVALAWHIIKPGKDELIFHNGETGGYHSYLATDPIKKTAVVILSNSSSGVEAIGNGLMKWLENE